MFKFRARKRTIGSLLAIGVLALATVLVSPTTPTAQAAVPCPTTPVPGTDITVWDTTWNYRGVTMCEGYRFGVNQVKVQIVDLAYGALLRPISGGVAVVASNPANNEITRRLMPAWAEQRNIDSGDRDNFDFSVTNASFFTSTTTPTTKLSLPFKLGNTVESHGVAIFGTDPNSATPKRVLRVNYNNSGGTTRTDVQIAPFPTIYTASDAQCSNWSNCVVGFDPLIDTSGDQNATNTRTFVGVNTLQGTNATRAFVLVGNFLTVGQAENILQHFGAANSMQLDGGGSTGMQSLAGHWLNPGRAVPNVLVVSHGPFED